MTFKTRRFIFYGLLFLFIITGFGVSSYSQGWRITAEGCKIAEWQNCRIKFQKTGAIFIETQPKGVIIKIDGKTFQDKSGVIQSGTLVDNLLPKTYKVEIEKDNYLSWEKTISVESGIVTELIKVVLVPQKLEKKVVSLPKSIDKFWINSQQKIIFKKKKNLYYFQESFSSPIKLRGDEFIQWSADNNKIIVRDSRNQIFYLYELNNPSKAININLILNNLQKTSITEAIFYPFESSRLIIRDKNGFLYLLDTSRLQLEIIIKEPVLVWTTKGPNIYYLKKTQNSKLKTQNYYLASFNLILKTENSVFELPPPLNNLSYLEIQVSGNKIALLTQNRNLYLFNQIAQNFSQIAPSVEKFIFSPDNKKIAFLNKDGKINIYFLEDYQKGLRKKTGEIISLNFYEGLAVKNIFWYKNSHHLLVEYIASADSASVCPEQCRRIDFVEIDDRLPINKYTFLEGVFNFHYESGLDRFYFIQENSLYFVEF